MNKNEKIVGAIILSIIAIALFCWLISPSTPSSFDDPPCLPDYMGGCN